MLSLSRHIFRGLLFSAHRPRRPPQGIINFDCRHSSIPKPAVADYIIFHQFSHPPRMRREKPQTRPRRESSKNWGEITAAVFINHCSSRRASPARQRCRRRRRRQPGWGDQPSSGHIDRYPMRGEKIWGDALKVGSTKSFWFEIMWICFV